MSKGGGFWVAAETKLVSAYRSVWGLPKVEDLKILLALGLFTKMNVQIREGDTKLRVCKT